MTQEEIRKLLKTYELHINQAEDDETALRDLSEVVHKVLTDSTRAVKLNACAVAAWALHIPVWGFAASKLWNWFLSIGPIPTIGVFHAAGIGLALEFIVDTTGIPHKIPLQNDVQNVIDGKSSCFDSWSLPDGLCVFLGTLAGLCPPALFALFAGWLIKFFMYL
jgi:hypothetical protein